jgi:putative transposase
VHRDAYLAKLRRAVRHSGLSLLDYCVTSNHVHLLAFAEEADQVSNLMKRVAGEFAQEYNRLKLRSGAFWEGRYHCTMVDSGQYAFQCVKYIELNMVRCGVVKHPKEWRWSGYAELMGHRKRFRLLDLERLLAFLGTKSIDDFRQNLDAAISLALERHQFQREPHWTESIAVGSQGFIGEIEERVHRQRIHISNSGAAWTLRESNAFQSEEHG